MSFIAGDIMIRMAADVASLKSDMKQAESTVSTAFNNMKSAAKGLAGLFAVQEIIAMTKAAIDMADKTEELSRKVGMTVEEVSALSLGFTQAGIDAGGMQTALVKLSKNVFENEAAFKALGISVKNADGSYRGSREVFADVADFFKTLPDGVTKTALATELFGKSGADLIPILNGGREGLDKINAEAKKFGAVISTEAASAAAEFNDALDILAKRSEAAKVNGLAPILPILAEIIKQFMLIGSATKDATEQISPWQKAFMYAAETVGVLLLNVVYVARAIGGEVITIGKQLMALATLDFNKFTQLGDDWTKKAAAMREEVDAQSESILGVRKRLEEYGSTSAETSNEVDRLKNSANAAALAKAEAALKAKELAAQQQKAAEAARKHSEEMDKLAESVRMENAGLSADFLRKLQQLTELRDTNRISVDEYNKALQSLIEKQPVVKEQMEAERKERELLAARQLESIKLYEAQEQKINAALKSAEDMISGIERETAALSMSNTERDISNALLALEKAGLEKGSYAYEEYAKKIRDAIVDRDAVRESIEKTKEIEAEWKKASDGITNGLTDALMRGFESGKGFAENLKDYIKNAFKTLVADFIVRPIMAPISGAMTSLFSGNAMASTGGAGGGLSSLLSSGMNLLNGTTMNGIGLNIVNSGLGQSLGLSSLQNIGGNMIAGPTGLGSFVSSGLGMLGNGMAGFGISSALSGGYSAGGKNVVNTIAGIASMIPGIGPIAGVVGALVNRAFGMKAKEMKDAGITGTITGGDATGQRFQDWFQKGGWFRSNKSGTDFSALGDDLSAALDLGAKGILDQTKAWADALKLPADTLAQVTFDFRTKLTGNAEEDKNAIQLIFEGYQNKLTEQFDAILGPFQKAGETIAETMQRLVALSEVSDQLNLLGGVFSQVATASIEARENIIGLAGGIEQLMAKAGQFVKDYYSVEEQAGLQAQSALKVLKDLGLDGSTITSREDFRKLVESIDVTTTQGQEQLVALLNLAPQFATLADYAKEQNLTLEEIAQQAPVVAILDQMLPEQVSTTAAVGSVADRIIEGNATLERIVESIQTGNISITAGLEALAQAQMTIANLQSQIVANTAATAAAAAETAASAALAASAPTYTANVGDNSFNVSLATGN